MYVQQANNGCTTPITNACILMPMMAWQLSNNDASNYNMHEKILRHECAQHKTHKIQEVLKCMSCVCAIKSLQCKLSTSNLPLKCLSSWGLERAFVELDYQQLNA